MDFHHNTRLLRLTRPNSRTFVRFGACKSAKYAHSEKKFPNREFVDEIRYISIAMRDIGNLVYNLPRGKTEYLRRGTGVPRLINN